MYWDTVLQQIFTVIKTGKKCEKLSFLAKKDTVRNFRNSVSENKPLFEILGNILKLYLAIIFGVRIFRVFEVSGKLPYIRNIAQNKFANKMHVNITDLKNHSMGKRVLAHMQKQ